MIEVREDHTGPVHCGAPGCGMTGRMRLLRFFKNTLQIAGWQLVASARPTPKETTITMIPHDVLLDIIDQKINEGEGIKLFDISMEYIADRKKHITNGQHFLINPNVNDAIGRILGHLEGKPEYRKQFEELAVAFKEVRALEDAGIKPRA